MTEHDLHPIVQDVAKMMSLVDGKALFHDDDRKRAAMRVMSSLPHERETVAAHLLALGNKVQRLGGKDAAGALLVLLQLVVDLVNDGARARDLFHQAGLGNVAEQLLGFRAELKAPRAQDLDRTKAATIKPKRGLR